MKIETALKRRDTAIRQLRDVYSVAAMCGQSHSELLAAIARIRQTTLVKAPRWASSEFDGYGKALDDRLYETSLMFGGFVDGRFYSTHRDRPDYYETNGIEPAEFADNGRVTARGHYWKTTKEPKPFFIS